MQPLSNPVPPDKPSEWRQGRSPLRGAALAALAAAALAGFAVRVFMLGSQSLWYDEGYSLDLARRDILSLTRATAADIHPPLYYYLLKAWVRLAGTSEFSLRYLSVLFGLLLVPASFALASRLFGRRVALVAAALAALSPLYVHYSQEVRMYTLMGLATLLAACFALRALATDRWLDWGVYVGCTVVALYSHLYSALAFGSLNVAFAAAAVAGAGRAGPTGELARLRLRSWALAQAAAVVLFAPWLGVAAEKYLTYTSPGFGSGLDWIVSQTAFVFSLGHSVFGITTFPGMPWYQDELHKALLLSAPFVAAAALGAVVGMTALTPDPSPAERERGAEGGVRVGSSLFLWERVGTRARTLFVLVYLLVPVLLIVLLSVGRRDFNARYLFAASPAYYILIALGLVWLGGPTPTILTSRVGKGGADAAALTPGPSPAERERGAEAGVRVSPPSGVGRRCPAGAKGAGRLGLLSPLLFALLALAFAGAWSYSLHNYYFVEKYSRDDHRSAVAYVRQHALPGDLVLLDFTFESVYRYYAGDRLPWLRLPETIPPDNQRTLATLARVTPQHPHVWLIMWGDYALDPDRIVQHWLEKNATVIDGQVFHGPVVVYGYLTAPPVLKADPRPSVPLRAEFGDQLSLLGYDAQTLEDESDRRVHLALYWQARRKMSVDYSVFAHLLNPAGQMVGLGDSQPVNGRLPTTTWEPGQIVRSELDVRVYPAAPPGDYRLVVGVYDQAPPARLPTGSGDSVELAPVHLARRTTATKGLDYQQADAVEYGDAVELVGHRLAQPAPDELRVTLFWRARQKPPCRYAVFNHLVDSSGRIVAQRDGEPGGGLYPTDRWEAGEVVRDEYSIHLPAGLAGRYRLLTGLYAPDTGERLAIRDWWPFRERQTAHQLGEVSVTP